MKAMEYRSYCMAIRELRNRGMYKKADEISEFKHNMYPTHQQVDINKILRYSSNTFTYTHRRNIMNEQMTKQFEQFADMMKAAMPQVKANKNGYEIRTKVLEMAQNQTWQDQHAKVAGDETTVTKEGDEVVTKVEMPTVPGADAVLEAAEKFYAFVNGNK